MEVGKLTVTARENFGKGHSRRIRAQGLVPGICYGPTLEAPLAISVDPKALKMSLDPLKRRNTLIDLTVQSASGDKQLKAIVIRGKLQKSEDVDADAWKQVRRDVLDVIRDEKNITSPKKGGLSVYGTNVLMNVGEEVAVICAEAIPREDQREAVLSSLRGTGHQVVEISFDQMAAFAGNMKLPSCSHPLA